MIKYFVFGMALIGSLFFMLGTAHASTITGNTADIFETGVGCPATNPTSAIYGCWQPLGTGYSDTAGSVMVDTYQGQASTTIYLEECTSSSYNDCVRKANTASFQTISDTTGTASSTADFISPYTMDSSKYYRIFMHAGDGTNAYPLRLQCPSSTTYPGGGGKDCVNASRAFYFALYTGLAPAFISIVSPANNATSVDPVFGSWQLQWNVNSATSSIDLDHAGKVEVRVWSSSTVGYQYDIAYVFTTSSNPFYLGHNAGTTGIEWKAQAFLYDHSTTTFRGRTLASSSVITFTLAQSDLPATSTQAYECETPQGITDVGGGISYGLCRAGQFWFMPSDSSVSFMRDAKDNFSTVFPFSVYFTIKNAVESSTQTASFNTDLIYDSPLLDTNLPILTSSTLENVIGSSSKATYFEFARNAMWLLGAVTMIGMIALL